MFRRLTEYPLEKRWEEEEAPTLFPIPARLVLNINSTERKTRYDRLEEDVHALVGWLNLYGFCHYIRETLPKAMEHANFQESVADHGIDAWLTAVADKFSDQSSPAALLHFLGTPSQTAAEILAAELMRQGAENSPSVDAIEEAFAHLIFIRLLIDALVVVIQSRDQRS